MKTPVLLWFLLSSSIALACSCYFHTTTAHQYLRSCVTAISALLVSSTQAASDLTTCQDERLGIDGAYVDVSVVSSEIVFLADEETFTVTVKAINDATFFYDGESISQTVKPTITFSQRMNCWWQRLNPFDCDCGCDF